MKKAFIGIVSLAIVAGIIWYATRQVQDAPALQAPPKPEPVAEAPEPVTEKEAPRKQGVAYIKPEEIPAGWEDFYEQSQMTKLNRVTPYMNQPILSEDIYAFFKAELFNREHWDVTR